MSDTASSSAKPTMKARIERLISEYGRVAVLVYFSIFAMVLVGFAVAIQLGFTTAGAEGPGETTATDSAMGTAGIWGAAWVATKVSQPLRIAATLALTPLVTRALRWLKLRE